MKDKLLKFYSENETRVDIAFFVGGFLFDVFTLSEVDDAFGIAQQSLYLAIAGFVIAIELLETFKIKEVPHVLRKFWPYSAPIFHFLLGGLLSVYSLFFLKSSSIFSSLVFLCLLAFLLVANELKFVQNRQGGVRVALMVICLLSFFSIVIPVGLGFVGILPTILAILCTSGLVVVAYKKLLTYMEGKSTEGLQKQFLHPSFAVIGIFLLCYIFGWIPPVPMAAKELGIYHNIEKVDGQYVLSHENAWWKIWNSGDQNFKAQAGDKIYLFASIYSPADFKDSVILHWYFFDEKKGWMSTDRIPMNVKGGRSQGYRGYAVKQNYQEGDWKISVETTDGREMGRIYLTVTNTPSSPSRDFFQEYR